MSATDEPHATEPGPTTLSPTITSGAEDIERLRAARYGLIDVLANLMIEHWRALRAEDSADGPTADDGENHP